MKICYVASGDSIHSYKWIKYFADQGHEVHWLSLVAREERPEPPMHYHEIGPCAMRPLSIIRTMRRAKKLIRQLQPDLLHVHYLGLNGLVGLCSGVRPMICTAWGSDVVFAGKRGLRRRLLQRMLQRASLITCDADHMRDAMVELGAAQEKISLINFGIDTARFAPRESSAVLRAELQLGNAPTVISLRNLEPVYDLATLIRAVPEIMRAVPEVQVLIVGTGSQEAMLRQLTLELGVEANVRFLGRIENVRLPEYLTTADVYVSTALSDGGIAASTAEAMACGVPVIVTDAGDNAQWITDGRSGCLVPVQDPSALAHACVRVLRDCELRTRLQQAGRDVILQRNDYYREMAKMEALYKDVIAR